MCEREGLKGKRSGSRYTHSYHTPMECCSIVLVFCDVILMSAVAACSSRSVAGEVRRTEKGTGPV